MIGHRVMGTSLLCTGDIRRKAERISIRRSRFTILPSIARWRRDLAKTSEWRSCHRSMALWMLGYPEAALADVDQALKDAREIGHAATLMYALAMTSFDPHSSAETTQSANAQFDELVALAEEKGALLEGVWELMTQGCLLALTGKASDAVRLITSGHRCMPINGSNTLVPTYLSYLAKAYAELGQFDDAWRCIGEAMHDGRNNQGKVGARPRSIASPAKSRCMSPEHGCRESAKRISSARSPSHVNNKPNPGNSAPP